MEFIVEAANVGCVPEDYFRPIGTFLVGAGDGMVAQGITWALGQSATVWG